MVMLQTLQEIEIRIDALGLAPPDARLFALGEVDFQLGEDRVVFEMESVPARIWPKRNITDKIRIRGHTAKRGVIPCRGGV